MIEQGKLNTSTVIIWCSILSFCFFLSKEFQTHTSQSGFTGMIHHPDTHLPSPILPPHLHSHYPPPPPPPPMRRNPRGHVDLTGYPTSLPHPQLQQQFRMGQFIARKSLHKFKHLLNTSESCSSMSTTPVLCCYLF